MPPFHFNLTPNFIGSIFKNRVFQRELFSVDIGAKLSFISIEQI